VNPADPAIRLHKLAGRLAGQWAISAGYDLRVVCRIEGDTAHLVSVGSHDEVY
jgi:mRNA-degrading endonuclease YafQ of YafQ-DinJ toxin-antitoxin module